MLNFLNKIREAPKKTILLNFHNLPHDSSSGWVHQNSLVRSIWIKKLINNHIYQQSNMKILLFNLIIRTHTLACGRPIMRWVISIHRLHTERLWPSTGWFGLAGQARICVCAPRHTHCDPFNIRPTCNCFRADSSWLLLDSLVTTRFGLERISWTNYFEVVDRRADLAVVNTFESRSYSS